MNDLARELVPLAVAIILSPFPLVPVVLLLLTARANANGGAFLAGWFGGLLVPAAAFAAAAGAIQLSDEVPTWAAWARLVLGLVLVVIGIRAWLSRNASTETPAWMAALGDYRPTQSARLGFILAAANPKSLLLVLAAGVAIGAAELDVSRAALAVLLFSAAAASAVAVPVLARLLLGERVVGPLQAARGWLVAHNAAIVAVVITVIGALVASKGWSSL